MNDKELIDWIKAVKPGENMPADTGPRMTRVIQILVDSMLDNQEPAVSTDKPSPVKGKLSLKNKSS